MLSPSKGDMCLLDRQGKSFGICDFPLSGTRSLGTMASFGARPMHFLSVDRNKALYCTCSKRVCARGSGTAPRGVGVSVIHSSRSGVTSLAFAGKTASKAMSPSKGRVTFVMQKRMFMASASCTAAGRVARAPTHRTKLAFTPSGHALTCTDRHGNG